MSGLMEVQSLTKKFDNGHIAVNSLSFGIRQGRCMALLGPNGAGKTTTLNMLAGLIRPTGGAIRFTDGAPPDLRAWIGFLPQHPAFFNWMSGRELLEMTGRLAHLSAKQAAARAAELLETVGLDREAAKRYIGGYSGGMKQRLGIAQALIHRPKLLMLDEPVSALDPIGRREVLELMQALKRETTLLFSTHVLHDAEAVCDDVLLLHKGKIAVAGELADVRNRYRRPLIRITGDSPFINTISGWEHQPFIHSVHINESIGSATLEVAPDEGGMEQARAFVCRAIAEQAIPVRQLEFGQSTLEDLFMQVVEGESSTR
ncbi:ABC transporter ATP-binding protein [Paenibacillus koleovorans]|uniref:ABC transporter ATP-binding protein n=1 Tax=Paenibacillus koleovorans TaxID=121608 RepID=UPI000FD70638|nr:ABC transporter ATP-binding protein [Paenibacillus koleovorans]